MKVCRIPYGDDEQLSVPLLLRSTAMYQTITQLCRSKAAVYPASDPISRGLRFELFRPAFIRVPSPPPRPRSDAKPRK